MTTDLLPSIPTLGYNTFKAPPNKVEELLTVAIKNGIRHIDTTASHDSLPAHHNETSVGNAIANVIKSGLVTREDLFVTAKLPITACKESMVKTTLQDSLKRLGLKYVDLYLVDWPNVHLDENVECNMKEARASIVKVWNEMEDVCESGLAKRIGVCNFLPSDIKLFIDTCKIKPAVNQIGVSVFHRHQKIVEYLKAENIHVMSHSPFGVKQPSSELINNPTVVKIANDLKVTPSQVLISWARKTCDSVVFKAPKDSYIEEDAKLVDIKDKKEELDRLN